MNLSGLLSQIEGAPSLARLRQLLGRAPSRPTIGLPDSAKAAVLAVLARAAGAEGAMDGLLLGLMAGVGFAAMAFATTHLFEHKPLGLWLIVAGYEVVFLAAAGVIVTAWR